MYPAQNTRYLPRQALCIQYSIVPPVPDYPGQRERSIGCDARMTRHGCFVYTTKTCTSCRALVASQSCKLPLSTSRRQHQCAERWRLGLHTRPSQQPTRALVLLKRNSGRIARVPGQDLQVALSFFSQTGPIAVAANPTARYRAWGPGSRVTSSGCGSAVALFYCVSLVSAHLGCRSLSPLFVPSRSSLLP